jgi:hypothetical protein
MLTAAGNTGIPQGRLPDEMIMTTVPVLIGSGIRLFDDLPRAHQFDFPFSGV